MEKRVDNVELIERPQIGSIVILTMPHIAQEHLRKIPCIVSLCEGLLVDGHAFPPARAAFVFQEVPHRTIKGINLEQPYWDWPAKPTVN